MISPKISGLSLELKKQFRILRASVWFFPVCLAVFFLLLTSMKLSGSSIGAYYNAFYGDKAHDPNLIMNHPQGIRSDEWLVSTQLTIAQSEVGYPRVNPNIDSGRDMSIVGDAPYKDWSAVFKPQNLAFFVLPLEYAFAFKWWLLLFSAITSLYFLILRFVPGKRLLSAVFATAFGCSPFLFWWYSSGTFTPIIYGTLIIILGIRIIDKEKIKLHKRLNKYAPLIYAVALGYVLACFALILYPPFQIPVLMVVVLFLLGYLLQKMSLGSVFSKQGWPVVKPFVIGCVLSVIVVLGFIETRSGVVQAINNSAYPGHRITAGGGSAVHIIFDSYLQPQLQRTSRAALNYYTNQSEASNFILLLPFLLVPGFYLVFLEYKKSKKLNWPLLLVQLGACLFLLNLFVAQLGILYKLTYLDHIPHPRLYIGLGFAGILQLLLIVKSLTSMKLPLKQYKMRLTAYLVVCLAVLTWVGLYNRNNYPKFIYSLALIGLLGIFFFCIIYALLSRKTLLAGALLLAFTLGSVVRIHPLYRGLGPIYHGNISKAISELSKPEDSWAIADNLIMENLALINGRDSLSGIKPYPDLNYWNRVEGSGSSLIYNRYAHVLFNSDPAFTKQLVLTGPDSFQVKFGCTDFVEKNVKFALATHPLSNTCLKKLQEVTYPTTTFYIYQVQPQ